MKNYLLLFLLLPLCVSAQVKTDSSVSAGIISKFERYTSSHQTEKVYLHFDRPYYAAGDTLFFKAYVTLSGLHRLSNLSGVLHAELIDNTTGKIISSEKLAILSGVAWGDFALSDSLMNNSYRIRAYTQLMLNDKDNLFEQDIPVVAVMKPKIPVKLKTPVKMIAPVITALKPDIQFFPEGGNIINGISSKVAFKAIAPSGLGIAVSGQVVDDKNNVVATFKDAHLGMGYFNFMPENGKTYYAKSHFANGEDATIALPKADETGIALSVDNEYASTVAQVKISSDKISFPSRKGQDYILSVFSNGQLANITCRLDSSVMQVNLYKWKMHSGITRLTLFSPNGEPVAERLIFIHSGDGLKLDVNSEKPVYASREKISLKLIANDGKDKPVAGNFSVSVTNMDKTPVDTNSENTIINNLLLTDDLKGNIEQPNYYLNDNTQAYNNLDILLLTQGYRGFEWKPVLADNQVASSFKPETALDISGTVKTPGGKLSPRNDVNLASMVPYLVMDTTADGEGNFTFNGINVIDTTRLLLRAKGNRVISITPDIYPPVNNIGIADTSHMVVSPVVVSQMKKEYQQLGNMRKGIVLKQVNIHAPKGEHPFDPKLEHSDNINGPGEADQVILMDDHPGLPSMPYVLSLIRPHVSFRKGPMLVVINGSAIPVNDISHPLDNIPVSDIYSIEVLYSPQYMAVYGASNASSVLVITTRNGSERNFIHMQPGLTIYKFTGFYKARTFYSPKYDLKTPANSIPDNRTTVYWNPVLITDKEGNASFNFYNNDAPGNYRVVVEGIDGNGNLGRQVYNYMVK